MLSKAVASFDLQIAYDQRKSRAEVSATVWKAIAAATLEDGEDLTAGYPRLSS
jgi:hypothetical protein